VYQPREERDGREMKAGDMGVDKEVGDGGVVRSDEEVEEGGVVLGRQTDKNEKTEI
jgi:hypothetical protein